MAEFCKQCTDELFGPDMKHDFEGLSEESDTKLDIYAMVLCEGCGNTLVNHLGECVDPLCLKKHGKLNET